MSIARISKFLVNVENITPLPDSPISTELTADELKALFDKGPKDIKSYINSTLYDEFNVICDAIDSLVVQTIPDGSVTTVKLDDSAVTTDKLHSGAVTTAKILDSNVTTVKIDDSAVTAAKIADGVITSTKLADNISLSAGMIKSGTLSKSRGGYKYSYFMNDAIADTATYKPRFFTISSSAPTASDSATDGFVWLQIID